MIKALSPECFSAIKNKVQFEGDWWKSDVYSFGIFFSYIFKKYIGLLLLEVMLLEDLHFLGRMDYKKTKRQNKINEAIRKLEKKKRYPEFMVSAVKSMLAPNPEDRPTFAQLTENFQNRGLKNEEIEEIK